MPRLEDVKPLSLENVSKSYGRVRALDSLTLAVGHGSVAGLVGPNGSGKTTALRIASGVLRPDAGRVVVSGLEQRSRAARANVAYVPDEPTGLDELTVDEFLALYAALYRAGAAFRPRAAVLLGAFGLASRASAALASLSHGMRRQVAMIAAFALAPPLVVVDEATAALDPEAVIVVREAVRALARKGCGVFVATQDLHFAETACDNVFLLSRGRLVAAGGVASLQAQFRAASLEGVFLGALGDPSRIDDLRDSLDSL